jgi:hypothetical protein
MSFFSFLRTIIMKRKPTFLYNLRTEGDHYIITKHDEDMEVVSKYNMSADGHECDCPQGHKPTCRHRKMFPMMLERVDTGWFFDFDNTGLWSDPFGTETPRDLDVPVDESGLEADGTEDMLDGLEKDELLASEASSVPIPPNPPNPLEAFDKAMLEPVIDRTLKIMNEKGLLPKTDAPLRRRF